MFRSRACLWLAVIHAAITELPVAAHGKSIVRQAVSSSGLIRASEASNHARQISLDDSGAWIAREGLREGWTEVFRCDGRGSAERWLHSEQEVRKLASNATRVKICTTGTSADCVFSRANTFPISQLQQGLPISHSDSGECDEKCVNDTWVGARRPYMKSVCPDESSNIFESHVYWACGNRRGLHVSATDRASCSWTAYGDDHISIYIDIAHLKKSGSAHTCCRPLTCGFLAIVLSWWNITRTCL